MNQLTIRQIQAISPNGVGAIFDVLGQSFVTCSIDQWPTQLEEVRSERLREILRVPLFKAPPAAPEDQGSHYSSYTPELPVVRFPTWLFCGACRRMVQWHRADENTNLEVSCRFCSHGRVKQRLTPMRWVLICPAGHLDDVDWVRFAHAGVDRSVAADVCRKRDALRFETSSSEGSGLGSLVVVCGHCRANRSLADIGGREATRRIGLRCRGRHPWQDPGEESDCQEIPLIVQRRAGNVYYADIRSAIEVPGEDPLTTPNPDLAGNPVFVSLVDQLQRDSKDPRDPQDLPNTQLQMFASILNVDVDQLRASLAVAIHPAATDAVPTDSDEARIAAAEWAALAGPASDTPDFITRTLKLDGDVGLAGTAAGLVDHLSQVTVVQTLREVRVHTGFHRVAPQGTQSFVGVDGRRGDGRPSSWLPAVEVRGEGVFIRFDESQLVEWENRHDVDSRVAALDRRAANSAMSLRLHQKTGAIVTPRYVLLHTLAHLVMRRMAFESGYGASSLRERIYARARDGGKVDYAGFLIYTAAGDAEGTLGGLARQGDLDRLVPLILSALEDASWCSADPLCGEQTSTSLDGLNMAACHACTLVSETSCESTNLLLDRCLVIGGEHVKGYFDDLMNAASLSSSEPSVVNGG